MISTIVAGGSTYVNNRLYLAFDAISEGVKDHSRITPSILVLSDGKDFDVYGAINTLKTAMHQEIPYTLHTFGYGNDHDPDFLM
jgi:hypothetical protein